MKRLILFLMLILLITSVSAREDLTKYRTMTIETKVVSPVEIITTSNTPKIEYIHINYSWIPDKDYRQGLLSITSNPDSVNTGDNLFFDIKQLSDFNLEVLTRTGSTSFPVKVKEKIPFPIRSLSDDVVEYTEHTNMIDINDEISSISTGLARNEDDLYVVVFKIADWVNTNIEYNLSSYNSEASLPSSWVIEQRNGVCDELSNLFVSMLRSLGIPARTVSGISYTNSDLFDYEWGPHGWTEVYFPDYGWIPFDPTYNQLGYVDATHIKMGKKLDSEKYNTQYTWKGSGFEIKPETQIITAEVVEKSSLVRNEISLDIDYLKEEVGFDSYNVVVAKIKNNEDYYVTRVLDISKVQGVNVIDEGRKDVLLKPGEEKNIYWIVKVDKNLDEKFIYTFPITIFTNFEEFSSEGFKAEKRGEVLGLEVVKSYTNEDKEVSASRLICSSNQKVVYLEEEMKIDCKFTSPVSGTINFCVDKQCQNVDVINNQFSITNNFEKVGYRTLYLLAENNYLSEETFLSVNVIDKPKLVIENLSYKETMKFDETSSIDFSLRRTSESIPRDVSVSVTHDLFKNKWKFDYITLIQGFSINIDGSNLKSKNNKFKIVVEYYDDKGYRGFLVKEFEIELKDITFWQRIKLWINDLDALFT